MSDPTRYPLTWPPGWRRRTPQERSRARFSAKVPTDGGWRRSRSLTVSEALHRLLGELDRLQATRVLVSTNVRTRLDGLPYSGANERPEDPGVAVYFWLRGTARCLACDTWDRVADNLAAIAAHIGAIRAIDRWGVGSIEQAFAGYTALPPTSVDWRVVLGVADDATYDDVVRAHAALSKQHHPDRGGRHEDMARINAARDLARMELEAPSS